MHKNVLVRQLLVCLTQISYWTVTVVTVTVIQEINCCYYLFIFILKDFTGHYLT